MLKIDLSGNWGFCLDKEKSGLEKCYFSKVFQDNICLPTTVSEAKKGTPSKAENTGFLTDPYEFEGYTWYSREIELPDLTKKETFLILERTRTSHVWVDDNYIGTNNSLCTSHQYRLTPYLRRRRHRLTILVDNTSCPVKGGHMTSQDTQTNWNGITGEIYIKVCNPGYLTGVKIYPEILKKQIFVKADYVGSKKCYANIFVTDGEGNKFPSVKQLLQEGSNEFTYVLNEAANLWSEHTPKLYALIVEVLHSPDGKTNDSIPEDFIDSYSYPFGLRAFKAEGNYFEINGRRTFLRGKHDGLIFPLTGYSPTDLKSWHKVLATAKAYGINHYRFHTCCPPEAAFTAADLLGIYMEPELPFWGTVTEEGDAGHDEKAQQYLIEEGLRILDEFGNHPSFVMMSLGNELWGSKSRLNEILGKYKSYDNRHLYTQGSNNFQFVPCILENEDFYCGVRFSGDRLFRGSYAMCDAPQGHIQTAPPDMSHNYNEMLQPGQASGKILLEEEILIQYGTGTKTVKAQAAEQLIPQIPVVSHEIGQYAMYPDYKEINSYSGVLKPRNLEIFRRRLEREGMLLQAERFFQASGRLAADCYKAEIETALRSSKLAGFQLLDLQDFAGQGTALVGILNAFMESKGLISEEEWGEFCSDRVIMAELPKLVYQAEETVTFRILLAQFGQFPVVNTKVRFSLTEDGPDGKKKEYFSEKRILQEVYYDGVFHMCSLTLEMPKLEVPCQLILNINIIGTDINNHYTLWLYPQNFPIGENKLEELWRYIADGKLLQTSSIIYEDIVITESLSKAFTELEKGRKVLLFPNHLEESNSIQGTYCTDFWCYPMFRSISESMNRPVPIGTLGLLIDDKHPVFEYFPTRFYTSAQWYDIITNSRSMILNGTMIQPMLWTIDNFERNNRLSILFEVKSGYGKLMVCSSKLFGEKVSLTAKWLLYSMIKYMETEKFEPEINISQDELKKLFNIK